MAKRENSLQILINAVEEAHKTIISANNNLSPLLEALQAQINASPKLCLPDLSTLDRLLNVPAINSSIVNLLVESTKLEYSFPQELDLEFKDYFQKIQLEWVSQLTEIGEKVRKNIEQMEVETKEISPVLQKSNLWLTPSMPYGFFRKIIGLAKNPLIKADDIEDFYLVYFSQGDFKALKSIVERWRKKQFFKERMVVIDDALEAHKNNKFNLSIPALLPLIEGIACDFSGRTAGHPKKTIKKVIGVNYPQYFSRVSAELFLNLLDTIGFFGNIKDEYFTSNKYSKYLQDNGINENTCLNRHAILHGVQLNYASEINSLKVFLILDMLC